ncbi:MAG: trypsin-like peptidase domain-containing protein [Paracoccaceae bacterium]
MIRIFALIFFIFSSIIFAKDTVPQSELEIKLSFVPLVKQAAPAVVNIYAQRIIAERRSPFSRDPFFRDFFRNFGQLQPRVQNSLGSGVILSGDGYVVSNYHVVGGATDIRVVLHDGREISGNVILSDEESDLAVLKLNTDEMLPHLDLRKSDTVEVGELVLAIGNPFGVGQTVTSGIISGLARTGIASGSAKGYFLQTDAPINPGNSGGALIDISGSLVGINTSILSRSGGSNGIGFAIPADLVGQFLVQAKAGRSSFIRPWAGMRGQPITFEMAASLNLPAMSGMIISELHELSPFSKVGIEVRDIITKVDGLDINNPAEMLYRMSVAGIGAAVDVSYLSKGTIKSSKIDLVEIPNLKGKQVTLGPEYIFLDLRISELTPEFQSKFGLSFSSTGLIVLGPGRIASRLGLRRGDLLREINGKPVDTIEDATSAIGSIKSSGSITIIRSGRRVSLRFRL